MTLITSCKLWTTKPQRWIVLAVVITMSKKQQIDHTLQESQSRAIQSDEAHLWKEGQQQIDVEMTLNKGWKVLTVSVKHSTSSVQPYELHALPFVKPAGTSMIGPPPIAEALEQAERGEVGNARSKARQTLAEVCTSRLRVGRCLGSGHISGCVNTVRFSDDGCSLVTSGDDCNLQVWSPHTTALRASSATGHSANVFSALFLPPSPGVVATCAADGEIRLVDVAGSGRTCCIGGCQRMVLKLDIVPSQPHCLVSAQMDRSVHLLDTRERPPPSARAHRMGTQQGAQWEEPFCLLKFEEAQPTSQCVFDPQRPNLFAVATDDLYVNVFDLRVRSKHWSVAGPLATYLPAEVNAISTSNKYTPVEGASGLAWHPDGTIAANYRGADAFLLDGSPTGMAAGYHEPSSAVLASYRGRANQHTFLKEIVFYEDEIVATGDDTGQLHLWHKRSGRSARVIKGDSITLNGLDFSSKAGMLATCGIDPTVKLLYPGHEHHGCNGDVSCAESTSDVDELPVSFRRRAMQGKQILSEPDAQKSIRDAEEKRNHGNQNYTAGLIDDALSDYDAALGHVNFSAPTASLAQRAKHLRLLTLLNRAACELKRSEWDRARGDCSDALSIDERSVKALYRRAQAQFYMGDLREARNDVNSALRENPSSPEARRLKQSIDAAEQRSVKHEKEVFSRMFSSGSR